MKPMDEFRDRASIWYRPCSAGGLKMVGYTSSGVSVTIDGGFTSEVEAVEAALRLLRNKREALIDKPAGFDRAHQLPGPKNPFYRKG